MHETLYSYSHYSVYMSGFNAFDVCFWPLSTKIIPSIEYVVRSEHLPLRSNTIQPNTLNFLISEKLEKLIDIFDVKI